MSGRCPACGHSVGNQVYCGSCGQETKTDLPSMKEFFGSFLEDAISFDNKLMRTAKPLLLQPGSLTTEYLQGRRSTYARPFRLYLVCSLLFFTTWILLSTLTGDAIFDPVFRTTATAESDSGSVTQVLDTADLADSAGALPDSAGVSQLKEFAQGIPLLGGRLVHQLDRLGKEGPSLFAEGMRKSMQRNLPRMAFLLVPVYALLLQGLYFRRRRKYLEHLVFALHVHSFLFVFFLLVLFGKLLPWEAAGDLIALALIVWFVVYMFRALRRVYGQGKRKTLIKFLVLNAAYNVILGLGVTVTAMVSFLES